MAARQKNPNNTQVTDGIYLSSNIFLTSNRQCIAATVKSILFIKIFDRLSVPVSGQGYGCGSLPRSQWIPGMGTWRRLSPSTDPGSGNSTSWKWQHTWPWLQR